MKRLAIFVVVLAVGVAALYFSQRRHDSTPVSANAVVEVAADAQRDLSRVPMRLTRLSDDEEIAIGNQLADQYSAGTTQLSPEELGLRELRPPRRQQRGVARSSATAIFVSSSAESRHDQCFLPSRRTHLCWEGLLDLMTSEDQLAAVLAHEVEHIDHYHCVERVQIEARLRNLRLDVVGALVQIPLTVWEAGYNKDEELEADREGMRLAVLSGYSPYGAVTLFEKFARLHNEYIIHAQSPEQELSELAIQSLEGYFRSHPQPSERLAQANRLIAEEGWQDRKTEKPFRVEYEVHNGKYVK